MIQPKFTMFVAVVEVCEVIFIGWIKTFVKLLLKAFTWSH